MCFAQDKFGLQRDEFLRKSLQRLGVKRPPARVDPDVAAVRPPELLESLPECGDVGLSFRVTLGIAHQHADPPHPVGLLRTRRERPSGRRAAQQRDELAPLHCPMPPVLPTERIAHLGTAGDSCAAGFQDGLRPLRVN